MTEKRLPFLVALAAALVYLLTLCWGTTVNSLPLAARVAGWDWLPMTDQPLLWFLTLPLHVLPAGWIPAGLNLFSASCAALTLGLLARSVQLFPWDCEPPVNKEWTKHLPVLLACGVCGLEFNFWSEATAASGVMLNQLLLAAAIWCVLEFRVGKELRWLSAAAVIWGAGMAQSWLLQVNLPLFIGVIFWLRGKKFFQWRFLLRLALFGLAGFSLYLLMPLVNGLNPHSPLGFHDAWLAQYRNSKQTLALLYFDFLAQNRVMAFALLLYFLVPGLPALIRLEDRGSKNTSQVDRFQKRIYRVVRGALLLVCLWLAFEPSMGPQHVLPDQFGISLRLLSFDYVNALGIGFLAGNLLFVLQTRPSVARMNRDQQKADAWRRSKVPVVMAGATVIILLALMVRNAPVILSGNWRTLDNYYGAVVVRSLPAAGGILLGDDVRKLAAVRFALAHQTGNAHWQTVHLPALASADYRAVLEREQPLGWLTASNRHELNVNEELGLLAHVAKTNRLLFLQPSPGQLLFEYFSPQASGIVAELKPYGTTLDAAPPLASATLTAGEKLWDDAWAQNLERLRSPLQTRQSIWKKVSGGISRRFKLEPMADVESATLAGWYSFALDAWGVELQRSEKLPAAQRRFEESLALNTNNWSAFVNLQANTNLQAGNTLTLDGVDQLLAQFDGSPPLAQLTSEFGPVDEPVVCFLLGNDFQKKNWPHQTVQQLERARVLAPDTVPPGLALAELYSRYQLNDQVFACLKQLRPRLATLPTNQMDFTAIKLDLLEAKAWMAQTNPANANRILQNILDRHPADRAAADMVWGAYLNFGDLTNALQMLTEQLAGDADNPSLLNNEAGILLMLHQPGQAVGVFQHALAITNSASIRLNLAGSFLMNSNLPAAETEYLQLAADPPDFFRVHSGLAQVAEQRHDTNAAIHQLELCLTNLTTGSSLQREVSAWLLRLKNPAAK